MTKKTEHPQIAGRKDSFSAVVADEILARISMGETLTKICGIGRPSHIPSRETVWRWTERYPAFRNQCARARLQQMLIWADDIISEADEATADFKVTVSIDSPEIERIEESGKVTFTLSRTHIKRAQLKIRTRQWLMERLNSEEFGLRQYLDVAQSYNDASDEELVLGFVTSCKKAGVTLERIGEWFENVDQLDSEQIH